MSDKVSINLDKILVKFASQIKTNHSAKEHAAHQINSYTAEITGKKNEIAWLEENIKKSNEAIADLQKHRESSKRHSDAWKPAYAILKKHGQCLNNEIKALEESTEIERKTYEDSITQCRMNLEEYHKKYTETALAQKYYQIKEEVEEIQKGVLKCLEKYKWKEDACLDILEAVPFASIRNLTVHIASMSKKAQETLWLAEAAAQETIKLEKEAEELQMKCDCLKKSFKETKEDQNNSEKIEGKNQKILEKPEFFKKRVFEEPSLPKGKRQLYKTLHVPCIPRKFVQSVQSFRFSKQRPETGKEEKEKSVELSLATSSSPSLAENLSQKMVIDTAGTNRPQIAQVPSTVSIKNQVKFRLPDLPKQLTSYQQFESGNAVMASQEAKQVDEEADEPMNCSYVPQDVHTGFKPSEDNPDIEEESAEPFLRVSKTPDLKGKNPHFAKTPLFDSIQSLGCEEGTSKSPAFFSHMNFSQRADSPGFNLFGSSLFGAQNSSHETEENYSVGNLNSLSSHEDIGSFFGKPENEDAFAFPFPSESTSHAFGDGKDDVNFSFPFGQDQRSPQSPSMKGFHSSSQNTKPFTLF